MPHIPMAFDYLDVFPITVSRLKLLNHRFNFLSIFPYRIVGTGSPKPVTGVVIDGIRVSRVEGGFECFSARYTNKFRTVIILTMPFPYFCWSCSSSM